MSAKPRSVPTEAPDLAGQWEKGQKGAEALHCSSKGKPPQVIPNAPGNKAGWDLLMPKVSGSPVQPSVIKEFLILQPTNTAVTRVSSSYQSWSMLLLLAKNDMNHQKRPCFLSLIWSLINGIMHHFYSKPFLSGLKNSLLNVLIQCLCINTISLFRFIYNKAILTSIHRKLCSGFNNVSFHSGIHRWLKTKN